MHINVHCNIIYNSQERKQSKCSLIDEWIKKIWNEILLRFRRNEILPFGTTQMNLKYIMLSEIGHTEKRQIPYDLTYMRNLENKTK